MCVCVSMLVLKLRQPYPYHRTIGPRMIFDSSFFKTAFMGHFMTEPSKLHTKLADASSLNVKWAAELNRVMQQHTIE